MNPHELTQAIKFLAVAAGFDRVGIAAAGPAEACAPALRQWLAMGFHADMAYMADNLDKRIDPSQLLEGAKSVICLAASYAEASILKDRKSVV